MSYIAERAQDTLYRAASDVEQDMQDMDGLICALLHMDFQSDQVGIGVHAVARAMEKAVRAVEDKRGTLMSGILAMREPVPPG